MPSLDKEGPVTLSVLDRLIDQEPDRNLEPPMTRSPIAAGIAGRAPAGFGVAL